MPDIDRDALNRALAEKLGDEHGYDHWALPDGVHRTPKEFCYSLDAAVAALNALGLSWGVATGPNPISCAFVTDGVKSCEVPSTDDSSAALATALVQAALEVLKSEEESNG